MVEIITIISLDKLWYIYMHTKTVLYCYQSFPVEYGLHNGNISI